MYPAGPWSDHTSTIAFTGDAWGTWNTLAQEAALTASTKRRIGEPYVSGDVGSYLGPPPTQSGADPPDLYDRWVQLGTFQPILRLHSNDEDRLPWQYPQPVQAITEDFLRLREALLPYTYTLGRPGPTRPACPIARPLYLDYPRSGRGVPEPRRVPLRPRRPGGPGDDPGDTAPPPRCGSPRAAGSTTSPAPPSPGLLGHPVGAPEPDAGVRPDRRDHPRTAHRSGPGHGGDRSLGPGGLLGVRRVLPASTTTPAPVSATPGVRTPRP